MRSASRALLCFLLAATAPPIRRVVVSVVGLCLVSDLGSGWIRESDLSCFGSLGVSGSAGLFATELVECHGPPLYSTREAPLVLPRVWVVPLSLRGLREIPRSENHTTRLPWRISTRNGSVD